MSWKAILKEIRMDKEANCCEEARMKLIEWFEGYIDKLPTKNNLRRSLTDLVEKLAGDSCDDMYEQVSDFMEIEDIINSDFFGDDHHVNVDFQSLRDIVDAWDKCKEEPIADKDPVKDNNLEWYKQTADSQTAWMDKFIRG